MKYGIDISVWQNPSKLNWNKLKLTQQFVICRATYGDVKDTMLESHFNNAKNAGMLVGVYHFFRQTKTPESQIEMFEKTCKSIGYGPGDIVPVLDVETNEKIDGKVIPEKYNSGCEAIAKAFKEKYGDCIIYTTKSFWAELGKPKWLLEYPQWVAHWDVKQPSVPGDKEWTIWQYKVASLDGFEGKQIDQNKSVDNLPLVKNKNNIPENTNSSNKKEKLQEDKDNLEKNTVKQNTNDEDKNINSNIIEISSSNNVEKSNIIFNLINLIIKLFIKIFKK